MGCAELLCAGRPGMDWATTHRISNPATSQVSVAAVICRDCHSLLWLLCSLPITWPAGNAPKFAYRSLVIRS